MATLIEQLPERIKALETSHGSDNPFVLQLKEQLRAMQANKDQSTQEVYRLQAHKFPVSGSSDLQPETEADGIRAEAQRRLRVRQLSKAQPGQTRASSPSPSDTPATEASPSPAKPNTSK